MPRGWDMYDPLETDLSRRELTALFRESAGIPICLIGGWATFFYVNERYMRAFGREYMGSRDIDIFFDSKKEREFSHVVLGSRSFAKDGLPFRYEKIYNRDSRGFVTSEQAKTKPVFNLIYIFLDLFSNRKTHVLGSWWDLEPLRRISPTKVGDFFLADIDTLAALKCTALFERDKADKESKDACDLYALMAYSGKPIKTTTLLQKAIEKMLARQDLLYAIAEHVLLDPSKQGIVEVALRDALRGLQKHL